MTPLQRARLAGARLWRTGGPHGRYSADESAVRDWAREQRLQDEATQAVLCGWREAREKDALSRK